jgi:hypothetical protein
MISILIGAALVVIACGTFWYFLPTKGQVNPLVENSDVGSMVMIGIMAAFSLGLAIMIGGFL